MELTNSQLSALNAKLPPKYKIQAITKKDNRPVKLTQRRSEAENLDFNVRFRPHLPEKRPSRDKRPTVYEDPDLLPRQDKEYKILYKILQTLKRHPMAEPFLEPVDPKQVPDYYEVIKDPMDLSTVEVKLTNAEYQTAYHFAMDIRTIWNNSFYYNAKGSQLYHMTMQISTFFEQQIRGHQNIIFGEKGRVQDLIRKVEKLSKGFKKAEKPPVPKVQVKPVEKPLSYQQKINLSQNIKKLDPRYLRGLLDIVQECTSRQGEQLQFDIDKLPPKVCRELEKYVKQSLTNSLRLQKKKKTPTAAVADQTSKEREQAAKLRELDNQLEILAQQSRNEALNQPTQPASASEDEESSSSDSGQEDDIPNNTNVIQQENDLHPIRSLYGDFMQEQSMILDLDHDFTSPGFKGMMDLDKSGDMFR